MRQKSHNLKRNVPGDHAKVARVEQVHATGRAGLSACLGTIFESLMRDQPPGGFLLSQVASRSNPWQLRSGPSATVPSTAALNLARLPPPTSVLVAPATVSWVSCVRKLVNTTFCGNCTMALGLRRDGLGSSISRPNCGLNRSRT